MSNVVILTRCSTEEQKDTRNGLNAQMDSCHAWVRSSGGTVIGTFSDEGVSGAADLSKRVGLMAAINALGNGDVLLVAKRDRLGRDPMVLAMIERLVAKAGARIISAAGEGTEGDDPSQILMRRMIDAFSEYERLILKARTKAALKAKKQRGERTGSVPYGFSLSPDGKTLTPNAAEQEVILEARKLRAGGMTLQGVAKTLADKGFRARSGKMFQATQIMRIAA